jgi:hypothetical protein
MSTPLHALATGSFTSTGGAFNLNLPGEFDKFEIYNITDIGSAVANTNVMYAQFTSLMPAGSAILNKKTSGSATWQLTSMLAAGGLGFTPVFDSGSTAWSAANNTITGITAANPAAVAATNTTGLIGGAAGTAGNSVIQIYNTTGMLQIAGIQFGIDTVVANTSFNLTWLNSAAFAAPATAGSFRIVPFDPRYYPRNRTITAITQAASAVITLSVPHQFTVGQEVRILCPSQFGMTQINNQLGVITAVGTAAQNTITVNINSTAYNAFAFPTSAIAAAGTSFAQVVPVGEGAINSITQPYGNLLDDATVNTSFNGIIIGSGVQTTAKLYQWIARTGVTQ